MKVFLISNTLFGFKNKKHLNTQLDYFNQFFIPFIQKTASKDDILIHLGNFFDSQNINVNIFNKCQIIFEKISQILPVKLMVGKLDKSIESIDNKINTLSIFKNFNNIEIIDSKTNINNITIIPYSKNHTLNHLNDLQEIVLFNSDYKNHNVDIVKEILKKYFSYCGCYNNYEIDDTIVNVGSPYQLDRDWTTNKGFLVIDTESKKHKFIENNSSPKFEKIEIKSIEDLKDLETKKEYISKNYIDVSVDQSLLNEKKLKLDIYLSKFDFNKIEYKGEDKIESVILSEEAYDIDKMIYEHITNLKDDELLDDFENIKKLSMTLGKK
jgi:hypothetical protein